MGLDLDYRRDPKGSNYLANKVRKAAKGFRDNDDVVFAVASKTDFAGELDKWGVGGRDQGVAVEKDGIRFRMEEEEFSPAAITAFVNAFLAGEVEAYVKSEPIPEQKPGVLTTPTTRRPTVC